MFQAWALSPERSEKINEMLKDSAVIASFKRMGERTGKRLTECEKITTLNCVLCERDGLFANTAPQYEEFPLTENT